MTELSKIYRRAPRQVSPDRLDDIVLARASRQIEGKKRSLLAMTPFKTLAVSFSVAGLAVALLFRGGVPPMQEKPGNIDSNIPVQEEVAASPAPIVERDLAAEEVIDSVSRRIEALSSQSLPASDVDLAKMPGVAIEKSSRMDSLVAADSMAAVAESAEAVQGLPIPSNEVSITAGQNSVVEPIEHSVQSQVSAPALVMDSRVERLVVAESESLESFEDSVSATEPLIVHSQKTMSAKKEQNGPEQNRQEQKRSRLFAPSAIANQPAPAVLSEKALSAPGNSGIILPPDSTFWVLDQPAQSFTLQLATASSQSYLQQYAESLSSAAPFYIVALATNTDTPNFGLLFGLFQNARQALDTIDTLGVEERRFEPWVRQLSKLQTEVLSP